MLEKAPSINVFGYVLMPCSAEPLTGFFRDCHCNTCSDDHGSHTVCAIMDEEFLAYSKYVGNDLSTPIPEYQFPGLNPGDRWCLCVERWKEALYHNAAPRVNLEATHISTLEFVDLEQLQEYAVESGG